MNLEKVRQELRDIGKSSEWIAHVESSTDNAIKEIKARMNGSDHSMRLYQKLLIAKILQESFDA